MGVSRKRRRREAAEAKDSAPKDSAPVESAASQTEPAPPVEPPRDAGRIVPWEWPRWPMPPRVLGRREKFQVLIRRSVLNDIRAHGSASPDIEVCGVIVGSIYHDVNGPWCFVAANIRGNHAQGRNAQVTFTSETWTDIHRRMETRYPKQRIVGWYHTHPGFGIFLSEMDVFIQENFFSELWQIAFVDDPKGGDRGVFVWRGGKPVREDYLIDEDVGKPRSPTDDPGNEAPEINPAAEEPEPAPRKSRGFLWIALGVLILSGALAAFAVWWRQ